MARPTDRWSSSEEKQWDTRYRNAGNSCRDRRRLAAPAVLRATRAYAQSPTIRVGHVSPRTGPLAGFAEADDYVPEVVTQTFAGGIENNGRTSSIEIISNAPIYQKIICIISLLTETR